ncbi:LysR substrate-binding domain-containing protein [Halomonas sp. M20]|uniref:LysR substrate-binding domain-containing protein n=1 Tax=Halomonas sp. M20 TaxID=2763264 RepID=UPI001D0B46B0|nr:LysR substrate-binding domain-containing protein [Halomonas sp. M20]
MRHLQPHIRYFIAIAEELHFRRAAERLHVAQPVLSRAIRQLEDQLGVILLQRSRRNVSLTAAGSVFLEECYLAREAMKRAEQRAIKANKGESGRLIVGYTDFAINGVLPSILATFHSHLAEVSIDLVRCDSHEQLEAIEGGRLDVGFLTGPVSGAGLRQVTVHEAPYMAVLPYHHPLADLESVPLKALSEEVFVLGNMHTWRHFVSQIKALCFEAGFIPRVVKEAPNSDSIFGLVAAQMGVTIYPDCDLNHNRRDIILRPLADTEAKLITEMVWSSSSTNPVVARFVDVVTRTRTNRVPRCRQERGQ